MDSEFWQGRSTLVTGGSGFLSFWLIPELLRRGARPVVLLRAGSQPDPKYLDALRPLVTTVYGEVTDKVLLQDVCAGRGVRTIFHLAAHSITSAARRDPTAALDVNIRGTWTVLEAARGEGCQVVLASSARVYANLNGEAAQEHSPRAGLQPYEASKYSAEIIAAMYASAFGLPVGIARCSNLYGGGDRNASRAVPGIIAAALREERFVVRGRGEALRDYLYVEDAVDGFLRFAEGLAQDPSLRGQAINFGSGKSASVKQLAEIVAQIVGTPGLTPEILGVEAEAASQSLNIGQARELLGWAPRHDLESGLRKTVAWYQQQMQHQKTAAVAAGAGD